MSNIFHLFSNVVEPNSATTEIRHYNNNHSPSLSQSLNQGKCFKKYQTTILNSLDKSSLQIEGFETLTSEGITKKTMDVLQLTDISSDKPIIAELQKHYEDTLKKYNDLFAQINSSTTSYIDRTNPNNKYFNKYITWNNQDTIMYVTNQGVAKPISNWKTYQDMAGKNNCPTDKHLMYIDIPWDPSYLIEGTTIPTIPPLIVGTSISAAQSCGNEGNNVYVNTLVNNSKAKYKGCYAADDSSMTFIGGSPPVPNYIRNGQFYNPVITNNSFQYITSSHKVPQWVFTGAALLNNSTAWGYPMPYPYGNQCVSLKNTTYIEQTIHIDSGKYILTFMACGRPKSGPNPIDVHLNGVSIYNISPPSIWTSYSIPVDITTSGNNTFKFIGTNSSGEKSSAIQKISISVSSSESGIYTYNMCKNEAFDGGYKYFALQNVNTETSKGYCAVSNDYISVTKQGTAYAVTKVVKLWNSQTSGQTGNVAMLNETGQLVVNNSSNLPVYQTTSSTNVASNYVGCYTDKKSHAMKNTSNEKHYNLEKCKSLAEEQGYKYYAGQHARVSNGEVIEWCAGSNNMDEIAKYGKSNNCKTENTFLKGGNKNIYHGGGRANAVYSIEPNEASFLILQDDGDMCIYRGTGPSDNQGKIWCSNTSGKQKKANPIYVAEKGKYGKNWISAGNTLAAGDFIGSTKGTTYLIMQTDGNLVLCTSETSENCYKMTDGNTGGGLNTNALYQFNKIGIPTNMGKVGYVDNNSLLHLYPESNIGVSNDYSSYTNYGSKGNDISGASISNTTADQCKKACNANKECYGFEFDKTNKVCYPKNKNMFPNSSRENNPNVDLYVRTPRIINPPVGITDKILNIDSISYEHYPKESGDIKPSYDLSSATSVQKQELDQLQSILDSLSSQINDYSVKYETNNNMVEKQSYQNINELNHYVQNINHTNNKIKGFNSNVDNILKDSDIVVLQKNYNYLFWSIIATATVLVSINVVKKN